jgi:hypothetical protein
MYHMHVGIFLLQVYVKDVFPNSGRFSVTMDPDMTKDKVRNRSFIVLVHSTWFHGAAV